jgi:hypothetical protein
MDTPTLRWRRLDLLKVFCLLTKVLARCEKFRAECPSQYYFELRTLNRNCHALR